MTTDDRLPRGRLLLDRGVSLPLLLPATLLVLVFLVGPFYYMTYTAMTDLSLPILTRTVRSSASTISAGWCAMIRFSGSFWSPSAS